MSTFYGEIQDVISKIDGCELFLEEQHSKYGKKYADEICGGDGILKINDKFYFCEIKSITEAKNNNWLSVKKEKQPVNEDEKKTQEDIDTTSKELTEIKQEMKGLQKNDSEYSQLNKQKDSAEKKLKTLTRSKKEQIISRMTKTIEEMDATEEEQKSLGKLKQTLIRCHWEIKDDDKKKRKENGWGFVIGGQLEKAYQDYMKKVKTKMDGLIKIKVDKENTQKQTIENNPIDEENHKKLKNVIEKDHLKRCLIFPKFYEELVKEAFKKLHIKHQNLRKDIEIGSNGCTHKVCIYTFDEPSNATSNPLWYTP